MWATIAQCRRLPTLADSYPNPRIALSVCPSLDDGFTPSTVDSVQPGHCPRYGRYGHSIEEVYKEMVVMFAWLAWAEFKAGPKGQHLEVGQEGP